MGTGNETWKVEGIKWGWDWGIDIIKVDLEGIGWGSLDFRTGKCGGLYKIF